MWPTLISIGPLHISSYGVFSALAFVSGSFLVWKLLKDKGIEDEPIFDNLIVTTIITLIGARFFYILMHWSEFSSSILKIIVLWKFPGLSFWGAFFSGLMSLTTYSWRQKLSVWLTLEAYAFAYPAVMFFMSLAYFLSGGLIGKETNLPWGITTSGDEVARHPIGIYGMISALGILLLTWWLRKLLTSKKFAVGTMGLVTISLVGLSYLVLAIFRADLIYWGGVNVDYFLALMTMLLPVGLLGYISGGFKRLADLGQKKSAN